jgi:hypothetical protein
VVRLIRTLLVIFFLVLVGPAIADDTHTAHIKIFCNSTGHIQLVSVDNGSYQTCNGGECFVEIPNSTTRWMPCDDADAEEIAKEVVYRLENHSNYKPLSEERIESIAINSSTYVKDSLVALWDNTYIPNVEAQENTKEELSNCTWKLREAELSKQNLVDKHQPEIKGYEDRIAQLESDNIWYGRFLIGGILIAVVFLLKERGIMSKNVFDKTKRRGK